MKISLQNQRRNAHHLAGAVALFSVLSHIFCCGLPMIVSIVSLTAGFGTLSALIPGFDFIHATIHHYEVVLIGFSLLMLALGWGLHLHAARVDCHDTGCVHPPCESEKKNASKLLYLATLIFVINLVLMVISHGHAQPSSTTQAGIHAAHDPQ